MDLPVVDSALVMELKAALTRVTEHVRQSAMIAVDAVENAQSDVVEPEQDLPQSKRCQRFGNFDVVDRLQLGQEKDGAAKLVIIQRVEEVSLNVLIEQFSNPFRLFHTNVMKPILGCLACHYGGDETGFCTAWSKRKFKHSEYRSTMCSRSESCTLE